jgi:hypothetical protein
MVTVLGTWRLDVDFTTRQNFWMVAAGSGGLPGSRVLSRSSNSCSQDESLNCFGRFGNSPE